MGLSDHARRFPAPGAVHRIWTLNLAHENAAATQGVDGSINDNANLVEQLEELQAGQEIICCPVTDYIVTTDYVLQRTAIYGELLSSRIEPTRDGLFAASLEVRELR